MKVLVTGGAGFIGSHTVDLLVQKGYIVRVLDNLDPQVHGKGRKVPSYLSEHVRAKTVEFIFGNILDRAMVRRGLKGVDAVIHLSAAVGVGQSMYSPYYYTSTNIDGTVILMEEILKNSYPIRKFIIASSMSIYGEGSYVCPSCRGEDMTPRNPARIKKNNWEPTCSRCGTAMNPVATGEDKEPEPTSVYALTKKMQEDTAVLFGKTYGIPVVALRYFNVYGPRQSLNNPYTGVIAIFLSRYLNRKPPLIFEDGLQSRDFIHVRDVARANLLALCSKSAGQVVTNIGTGTRVTILEISRALAVTLGVSIEPTIMNCFRTGDIRHCFGNPSLAQDRFNFSSSIPFLTGLQELVASARKEKPKDYVNRAHKELVQNSLVQ